MGDLTDRFGLLHLGGQQQQQNGQGQNGLEPASGGGLGVPEGQGVRKQRSQRFTVPTSPPRTNSSSLLPTSPSTHTFSALPYQPPPPPVQTQSIPPSLSFLADPALAPPQGQGQTNYYSSRAYSSSGSSNGGEPSPQPAYAHLGQAGQPYRPVSQADFLAPAAGGGMGGGSGFLPFFAGLPNGGGGLMREASPAPPGLGQGGKVFNEEGEEIIETAIVIKSIPFIAVKEQLLAVMDSLSLPPPFAFNFHYDQGQFRGLAFANYRMPGEAQVTVSALNGFEFMGRKLRAEFKRALKPGEKEAIERNKAIKRMRSAQLLAAVPSSSYPYAGGAGGGADGLSAGPPQAGWNRREASAPGGYAGYGGGGVAPPVPQIPLHLQQHQQQQYAGYLPQHQQQQQQQEEEVDYGRPLLNGTFSGAFSNGGGLSPSPAPSALSSAGGGSRSFQPAPSGLLPSALPLHSHSHNFVSPIPAPLPVAPAMEFSYSSSSSPPSSDVGTSVSQRMGGGGTTVGTGGTSSSEGDVEGEVGSAVAVGRGKDELDLNDPLTLDLYSRILLFRDDQLRDELAFARSLTTSQRRIVHLVAKKLGLEHGSSGEGEGRRAVVWKKGAGPLGGGGGGGREEVRRLRQTVSSAAIRRPPSTNDLLSSSPAGARGYNSSSPFASRPTSSYLSASPSSASSSAQQHQHQSSYQANLRGKKSMPDIRYSRDGHILAPPSSYSTHSSASASSSRSPSPAVPPLPSSAGLPQSTSLAANLAAYSSGSGYAPASSSTFGTPIAAQKRRSYASLRTTTAGGGGGWESPGGLGNGSNFATVAGIPHSFSASSLTTTPTRGGSRPSVQNLFGPSCSPTKEKEEQGRNLFWASSSAERQSTPGKAEAVRQPAGPSAGVSGGSGAVGEELEWRKR